MQLYRVLVIGFCAVCLLIGFGFNPSSHHQQPECGDNPVIKNTSSSESAFGPQTKRNQDSVRYNKNFDEIACSSLRAEWVAVDAAERTFWLTVAGIVLIAFTLYETMVAGNLLAEQNRLSERANMDQNRSYVFAEKAIFIGNANSLRVQLRVKNTGFTPARWFEVDASARAIGKSDAHWGSVRINPDRTNNRWPPLANGCWLTLCPQAPREAEFINEAASDPKIVFLITGVVRYETVFREICETQFAFHSSNPATPKTVQRNGAKVIDYVELQRPPIPLESYKIISGAYGGNPHQPQN